ncbi:MAG TPA: type II secretion system F family protein [Mycobacteriales bacterium]|jgi:tight adherence protein C|nr:type II secretion system F family protein [Mycobacteriales bacterium]
MTLSALGAGLGATSAAGLVIAARSTPLTRRVRLEDRVAPYLADPAGRSRLLDDTPDLSPIVTAERLLGPALRDVASKVDEWVGGGGPLARRLDRAGRGMTVQQFRIEQVLWAGGGLGVGLLLALLAAVRGGRRSSVGLVIVAMVFALVGLLLRDRALSREITRRESRMAAEFPTIAELLALAVGAGESPIAALERVARCSRGELSAEIARVLADTRAGANVVTALEALATRTGLPALVRFVDGMAIAVERGTPLADVLRAQASDAREEGRRALLEAGGRKEIAMLVPVVFFVLPVTVVFALFPGFYGLRLAVP